MKFGNRLKQLRRAKQLTQAELAKFFSLGESTISFYENGKRTPDYETLEKFADFFNVSVDYLLGRTDNPKYKLAQLTPELQELGVEYIALAKEFKDNKIPPEDVKKILEAIKNIKNN